MFRRIQKLLGLYKTPQQLNIIPYRSYGTENHLYVKGRVLDNEPLKISQDQSFFKTLKNTYLQFNSFEVSDAHVSLTIPNQLKLETKTDKHGYFLIDKNLEQNFAENADEEGWLNFQMIYTGEIDERTHLLKKAFSGELLIPEAQAEYGVISDIDDTILHTGVSSFLKLRLLKNSLLTNAYARIPLKGAPEFYKKLHLGKSGANKNPIFYLSNSPWNLYQYLKLFLDHNQFPKGPILLRRFVTPFDGAIKPEKPHKQKEIQNILKTYPQFNFILIGDSGEHDASIYTDIAADFPGRILAIYLRSVKHKRKMLKVENFIKTIKDTPVVLVRSSAEATEHARENNFIQ